MIIFLHRPHEWNRSGPIDYRQKVLNQNHCADYIHGEKRF